MKINTDLILSTHRALIRAIQKNLKGLKVKIIDNHLIWWAYFDDEPTKEEKEILSVACTEVIADFNNIQTADEKYIHHPTPLLIEAEHYSNWAYVRWEPERDNE